jgi:hypothetical protein
MKTPRELLLEQHRQAASKLDAIRRETLASMEKTARERSPISWRDVWHSLRWHLAGLSAVWVFVLFLNLDTGRSPQMMANIAPAKIPSPQIIVVSLRENRRQLAEMIDSRPPEKEPRELALPKPRSELRGETLIA